jgi:hypothetical protein
VERRKLFSFLGLWGVVVFWFRKTNRRDVDWQHVAKAFSPQEIKITKNNTTQVEHNHTHPLRFTPFTNQTPNHPQKQSHKTKKHTKTA